MALLSSSCFSKREVRVRWIVLALLIAGHLAIDLVVPSLAFLPRSNFPWQVLSAVAIGLCISQIDLIALWATLAGGPVAVRLPWSLFLLTLMWNALGLGNRWYWGWNELGFGFRSYSATEAITLGVVLLSGLAVALVPLWIARNFFRWRLRVASGIVNVNAERPAQFSIAQLMLGTALLSVALGISRLTMPPGVLRAQGDWEQIVIMTAVVALVNLVTVLPCVWGAFLELSHWPWLAVAWIAYGLFVTLLEIGLFCSLFGSPPDGVVRIWAIFSVMNLTQCASVFLTFALLRGVGFQFVREGHSTAISPLASPPVVLAIMVEADGNGPVDPVISKADQTDSAADRTH